MKKDCSSRIIRPKHPYDDEFNIHNALTTTIRVDPIGYNGQYGIFANNYCYGLFQDSYQAQQAASNLRQAISSSLISYAMNMRSSYEYMADYNISH